MNHEDLKEGKSEFSDGTICRYWGYALEKLNIKQIELLTSDSMPPCCTWPYINTGYRKNPTSITSCIKSVIHPTNETLNFWTHFIPMIWLLCRHRNLLYQLDTHMNDYISYPFIAYSIGCFILLAGSSFAHLFDSMSPTLHQVCFCCDYSSISTYCIGTLVSYYYYISPPHCHDLSPGFGATYVPLGVILITATHIVCCHTQLPGATYGHVLRTVAHFAPFISVSIPAFARLVESTETFGKTNAMNLPHKTTSINFCENPLTHIETLSEFHTLDRNKEQGIVGEIAEEHVFCHLAGYEFSVYYSLHLVLFVLAAVLNTTKFPEKFYVGKFDIVGNSHQLFHIVTALAVIMQSFIIEEGLKDALGRHSCFTTYGHFAESTLYSTVGVIAGSFVVYVSIVIIYARAFEKHYH